MFREWLPVAVLLGFVLIGTVAAGAAAYCFAQHAFWVLLAVVCVGGVEIYFGEWPPIEYALVLMITSVFAGLLLPMSEAVPFISLSVCLPGAFVSYLCGGNLARILDKRNVDRLTAAARDESADRK